MKWNYRVMAHICKNGDIELKIHAVFYNKNNKPISHTASPSPAMGEDIKELAFDLGTMKKALYRPILYYGDKFPQEYKPTEE